MIEQKNYLGLNHNTIGNTVTDLKNVYESPYIHGCNSRGGRSLLGGTINAKVSASATNTAGTMTWAIKPFRLRLQRKRLKCYDLSRSGCVRCTEGRCIHVRIRATLAAR